MSPVSFVEPDSASQVADKGTYGSLAPAFASSYSIASADTTKLVTCRKGYVDIQGCDKMCPAQAAHELEAASLRGAISAAQETVEELRAQGEEQARSALAAQEALQERVEQLQAEFASLDTAKGQCIPNALCCCACTDSGRCWKLCQDIARLPGSCWHASNLHITVTSSTLAVNSTTWVG